jgi:hypothetical protein
LLITGVVAAHFHYGTSVMALHTSFVGSAAKCRSSTLETLLVLSTPHLKRGRDRGSDPFFLPKVTISVYCYTMLDLNLSALLWSNSVPRLSRGLGQHEFNEPMWVLRMTGLRDCPNCDHMIGRITVPRDHWRSQESIDQLVRPPSIAYRPSITYRA